MDFQNTKMDLLRAGGQKFRIQTRCKPMFYDPDDPDPDDIEYEEDEHVPFYERDYESKGSTKIQAARYLRQSRPHPVPVHLLPQTNGDENDNPNRRIQELYISCYLVFKSSYLYTVLIIYYY